MRSRTRVLICAGLSLIALASLIGCGGSSNHSSIRLVNATPDENGLDLLIDTHSAAAGVGYGTASPYVAINTGSRQLQVEPSGTNTPILDRTDTINANTDLTLLTLNFSFNISSVLLGDDNTAPTTGNFKLRIINASPGTGPQDIYVLASPADLSAAPAPTFSSLAFGSTASYLTLAAGDYEVFFTAPGTKIVNLDTGTVTFNVGQIRTLLSLNNPGGGFQSAVLTDAN